MNSTHKMAKYTMKINPPVPALTAITIVTVLATALTGCNRGIQLEKNEPTKLVSLQQNAQVVTPIYTDSVAKTATEQGIGKLQVGMDKQSVIVASPDGTVATKTLQGTSVWQRNLGEPILAGVALSPAGDLAVVSTKSAQVVAINTASGQVMWQTPLKGTVLSPALIHDNRVVVMSNDGVVHGLSQQTGQVIWQFATQTPSISVRGSATPTLLNDKTVLIASSDGRLHALDINSGIPSWSRRVGIPTGASEVERMTDVDATPTIDGNQLYAVSYSGQLVGVDLSARQIQFVKNVASKNSLALNANDVIVTTLDGTVQAFDRNLGELNWDNDDLKYRQLSNPVMVGNAIAIGDYDGFLHFLDSNTGNIIGRERTDGSIDNLTIQTVAGAQYLTTQTQSGRVAIWQIR